jgi:hypothetical protein
MKPKIDLRYRPRTYFRPQKLETYILSKVKGAVLRKKLRVLFDEGRHADVRQLADDLAFSASDRKALEAIHPMYMGGNYLPDAEAGEVEIARISVRSTTFDVTSVYARTEDGTIHYRVVDEYGGNTLQGRAETQTTQPMTLGEIARFFMTAWPLISLLEINFEDDVESALGFFSADSDFYPDLDRLCEQRVRKHFRKRKADAARTLKAEQMTPPVKPGYPEVKHSEISPGTRLLSREELEALGIPLDGELIISLHPALSSKRSPGK